MSKDDIRYEINKLHIEQSIVEGKINAIAREHIREFSSVTHSVGYSACSSSPIATHVFHEIKDPDHMNCIFCNEKD